MIKGARSCVDYGLSMQWKEDDGRGLVDNVMDLLGIDSSAIGESSDLAGMGIDSMQARSHLCCSMFSEKLM